MRVGTQPDQIFAIQISQHINILSRAYCAHDAGRIADRWGQHPAQRCLLKGRR